MVEFINLLNETFKGPRLPDASHIGTTNGQLHMFTDHK